MAKFNLTKSASKRGPISATRAIATLALTLLTVGSTLGATGVSATASEVSHQVKLSTWEHSRIAYTVPAGYVISSIDFASYGKSNSEFTIGWCHSTQSLEKVRAAATLTSLTISAENQVFGDPCRGTVKQLYVILTIVVGDADSVVATSIATGGFSIASTNSSAVGALTNYQYSKDGGSTWIASKTGAQPSPSVSGYQLKMRAVNNVFTIDVTAPLNTGGVKTFAFSLDGGQTWTPVNSSSFSTRVVSVGNGATFNVLRVGANSSRTLLSGLKANTVYPVQIGVVSASAGTSLTN